MATDKEMSVDAAVTSVLSELKVTFALKHKTVLKVFLGKQGCFALLLSGFGKSSDKHYGA